jgi:hypothetical protein
MKNEWELDFVCLAGIIADYLLRFFIFVGKFNLNNARKFGNKTGKFEMIYLFFLGRGISFYFFWPKFNHENKDVKWKMLIYHSFHKISDKMNF